MSPFRVMRDVQASIKKTLETNSAGCAKSHIHFVWAAAGTLRFINLLNKNEIWIRYICNSIISLMFLSTKLSNAIGVKLSNNLSILLMDNFTDISLLSTFISKKRYKLPLNFKMDIIFTLGSLPKTYSA